MRKSGILMPVSALYGEYGIGDMGKGAYEFADFLAKSGQSCWQLLPMCQTAFGDSPYQSPSAFAGNEYFISVGELYEKGLITQSEKTDATLPTDKADYGFLWKTRHALLEKAADRMKKGEEYYAFAGQNKDWLFPYALFYVLRNKKGLTMSECMKITDEEKGRLYASLGDEIESVCAIQYLFFFQWFNLKKYANNKGVQIIGDIPIYTAYDSADVWDNRHLFMLDGEGLPAFSAGCPPDAFSPLGQLWGNPIYNWQAHEDEEFGWWMERFRHCARMYDMVRIDHFRGFYSAYAVPYGRKDARQGNWIKAPGEKIVSLVKQKLPDLHIIAEDLGFITDEVRDFFEKSGFPGMKVMQFSFSEGAQKPYSFPVNSVAYTGTHDNMTLCQWIACGGSDVTAAMDYYGVNRVTCLSRAMIRGVMETASELAVIPIQDWLNKGAEGRMNTPGTQAGNWVYRVKKEELTDNLASEIKKTAVLYGRI